MYGEQNNLEVSMKAKDLEDILRKVPTSFDKIGIEFMKEGEKGSVRIRIKNDESTKQFVYSNVIDMKVINDGYLLIDGISEVKQILSKFGDNMRIRSKDNEQIIFEDENGDIKKTPPILEFIKILAINKIFPYENGRILYPKKNGEAVEKDEQGKPIMAPSDSFATLTIDDMKRALQDAVISKHDYISLHLVPGESYSISGKYDAKGTKSTSKLSAVVGGSGDIDLPKSVEEFIKTIGSKDDSISIHFSDKLPVATFYYNKDSEVIMYTIVKLPRGKPGDQ